jgi:integrase
MYLLATELGLRKNELVSLKVESFDLDKGIVKLPREIAKNRHAVELPLRQERIAQLREYFVGKFPAVRLFHPVTQSLRASNMLKKDLKDAGIPFKTDKGVVVFHALRNTFSTNLGRTNASWIEHKILMRHSLKGEITADYTEVSIDRQREIVEQLPSFTPRIKKAVG